MTRALWVLTAIGACLGAVVLIGGEMVARSAPQEAAAAALGVGLAVIPYCLARAWSELNPRGEK